MTFANSDQTYNTLIDEGIQPLYDACASLQQCEPSNEGDTYDFHSFLRILNDSATLIHAALILMDE